MERPNQGIPHDGNPSPFSSWGEVGAPHMATLSLPGLTIGLPIWLFSTNVVQNTMVPEQSSQQLDQSRAAHQPSTSYNSSSDPSSSQGRAGKSQAPMEKKEKKKKEKKKKEPKATGGKQKTSDKNPHTAQTGPKSPCAICRGDHFHRDCPCIPRILRDWSPRLHNSGASTSDSHVECLPSTSESEGSRQRGGARSPCRLCEGDHAIRRCPFLKRSEESFGRSSGFTVETSSWIQKTRAKSFVG